MIKASLLPPLRRKFSKEESEKIVKNLIDDVYKNPDLISDNFKIGMKNTIKAIKSKKAKAVLIG